MSDQVSVNSKLYRGEVMHWRNAPHLNKFTYTLFMLYLDLDELTYVFKRRWFWSTKRFNLAEFRREDHLPGKPCLKETVLDKVEEKTGHRPTGRVCLLTHLRYFGYVLNPVSFYYCFDDNNDKPVAIVAEVTNVPWGETHIYVLDPRTQKGNQEGNLISGESAEIYRFEHDKEFHVSPFLPMDMRYFWRVSMPEKTLNVTINSKRQDKNVFSAELNLQRRTLTSKSLTVALLSFPFMTLKVLFAIYYEALKLWLRKAPFYPNIKKH